MEKCAECGKEIKEGEIIIKVTKESSEWTEPDGTTWWEQKDERYYCDDCAGWSDAHI